LRPHLLGFIYEQLDVLFDIFGLLEFGLDYKL